MKKVLSAAPQRPSIMTAKEDSTSKKTDMDSMLEKTPNLLYFSTADMDMSFDGPTAMSSASCASEFSDIGEMRDFGNNERGSNQVPDARFTAGQRYQTSDWQPVI
jgi:hypothetical protein